jgi:hypothetical protein
MAGVPLETGADAVRRRVTGFVSGCSWLPGVALSDFERALARVLVVVGFACSFPSGDSEVFLMKKTPFYRIMRHKWRRKSLFTATRKDCHLFQKKEKETVPRWCSARHVQSAPSGVVAMVS